MKREKRRKDETRLKPALKQGGIPTRERPPLQGREAGITVINPPSLLPLGSEPPFNTFLSSQGPGRPLFAEVSLSFQGPRRPLFAEVSLLGTPWVHPGYVHPVVHPGYVHPVVHPWYTRHGTPVVYPPWYTHGILGYASQDPRCILGYASQDPGVYWAICLPGIPGLYASLVYPGRCTPPPSPRVHPVRTPVTPIEVAGFTLLTPTLRERSLPEEERDPFPSGINPLPSRNRRDTAKKPDTESTSG